MKDNIHEGHRERLIDLICQAGIENVSEIQAVEGFLTYIFPRGDVNPLAHRLLEKYGTFHDIVDATIEDLKGVYGINDRSAKKISLFPQFTYLYTVSKMENGQSLNNTGEFFDDLENLLRSQKTEQLLLFAIDNGFKIIQVRRYSLNNVREVGIEPFELFNFINSTKLSYIIVAHNHPNGTAQSSPDDKGAFQYIEKLIENFSCSLIDSFVVGVDGIYSEKQNGFVRRFPELGAIINFFQKTQQLPEAPSSDDKN